MAKKSNVTGGGGLQDFFLDPDLEKRVEEIRRATERQEALLQRMQTMHSRIVAMKAEGLRSALITDPVRAEDLTARHNALNIAVRTALAALDGDDPARCKMQQHIEDNGGFFWWYEASKIRKRIEKQLDPQTGGWLVVASYGKPDYVDVSNGQEITTGDEIEGGDIQTMVPPNDNTVALEEAISLEGEQDDVYPNGEQVYDSIVDNPATAAWLADVCSERGLERENMLAVKSVGFASTATNRTLAELENANLQRKNPIKWLVAAIADVTHVKDVSADRLIKLHPTWFNERSFGLQRRRRSREGEIYMHAELGEQVGRELELVLPGGRKVIIYFNWKLIAQEVKVPKQRVIVP